MSMNLFASPLIVDHQHTIVQQEQSVEAVLEEWLLCISFDCVLSHTLKAGGECGGGIRWPCRQPSKPGQHPVPHALHGASA